MAEKKAILVLAEGLDLAAAGDADRQKGAVAPQPDLPRIRRAAVLVVEREGLDILFPRDIDDGDHIIDDPPPLDLGGDRPVVSPGGGDDRQASVRGELQIVEVADPVLETDRRDLAAGQIDDPNPGRGLRHVGGIFRQEGADRQTGAVRRCADRDRLPSGIEGAQNFPRPAVNLAHEPGEPVRHIEEEFPVPKERRHVARRMPGVKDFFDRRGDIGAVSVFDADQRDLPFRQTADNGQELFTRHETHLNRRHREPGA